MRHWIVWGMVAAIITGAAFFLLRQLFTGIGPLPAYAVAINAATLLIYALDKVAAGSGSGSRAPNLLLVLLAVIGGSVGALVGVYGISHKTGDRYPWFRAVLWLAFAIQVSLVAWRLLS